MIKIKAFVYPDEVLEEGEEVTGTFTIESDEESTSHIWFGVNDMKFKISTRELAACIKAVTVDK